MLRELSNLVIQGKTVDHLGHQLETVTYFVLAGRCYPAPSISNLTLDEGFFSGEYPYATANLQSQTR